MQYDLGSTAQIIVILFAIGFGAVVQLIVGNRATRWLWLTAAVGWLVGAVFIERGPVRDCDGRRDPADHRRPRV